MPLELLKREYLSAIALSGLLANQALNRVTGETNNILELVDDAIYAAEQLICALNSTDVEEPSIEEFSVPVPGDSDYDN